jgi:hypothetical protein
MMRCTSIKQGLARVGQAWKAQRFDDALAEIDRLLAISPCSPPLLVKRAQLIQLQDDEDGTPTLDDAKADLKLATDLDDQSPAGLIELGCFLLAVEDDPKKASVLFQKAILRCRDLLEEALRGQAEAEAELGRDSKRTSAKIELLSLLFSDDLDPIRDHLSGHLRDLIG